MNYFSYNKFITVNLKGGIGNQLFQIATAYGIAKDLGLKFVIFRNQFEGCNQGSHPKKYYDSFYKNLTIIDPIPITHNIKEHRWAAYKELKDEVATAAATCDNICIQLDGYFQSDLHFENLQTELCNLFMSGINVNEILSDIYIKYPELVTLDTNKSVFIGVRRGDYVERAYIHNPCGMTYYNAAISMIPTDHKFYIMSDDLDWAKKNFIGDQYVFLDIADDLSSLLVISLFKKFIISNSSYYWWGSYLSGGTEIIAPDKWLFGPAVPPNAYWTIYRKIMKVIERPIEI
jgi:hypothetical protein